VADPSGRQRRGARILSDINMLVLSGGQERINAGYCELLTVAGLKPGYI